MGFSLLCGRASPRSVGAGVAVRWARAATISWPSARPPSSGGTRWWRSTVKPSSRRPRRRPRTSRVLANTPPVRATVSSPCRSRARTHDRAHEAGDGPVEAGRDQRRLGARAQVADDRREHGCRVGPYGAAPVRLRRAQGERVAARVRGRRAQRRALQLDGGLRLVPGPVAHAGQRGHGVEEPAHAGGGDAVQPRSSWRSSSAEFVGRAGGRTRQVVAPSRSRRPAGGPAPCGTGRRTAASPPGSGTYARCAEPGEAVVVGEQELAAPHGAVVAVARAVEGDADHRPGAVEPVFGHRGGDVGVVVLDAHERAGPAALPVGPPGGAVAGVPVGDQRRGPYAGRSTPAARSARSKARWRAEVVHVADVRGQPGPPARRRGRRCSSGRRRRRGPAARAAGRVQRQRGVAARAADRQRLARRRPGPRSRRTARGSAGRG